MRDADILDRLSIRAVCKTEDQVAEILDRLDGGTGKSQSIKREAMRFRMNDAQCIVVYDQSGQLEPAAILAPPRNLSSGGMAFLNDRYMNPDIRCVVYLLRLDGNWEGLEGQIVRCRYVENWVHEVSVKFKTPIEPEQFCRAACRRQALLIESDETQRGIAAHYLTELNCAVTAVASGKEALESLESNEFQIIVCESDTASNEQERETIRGKAGKAVIVAAVERQEVTPKLKEEGFSAVLTKPYTPTALHQQTRTALEALIKPYTRGGKPSEFSIRVVELMEVEVDQLRRCLDEGDMESFRRLLDATEAEAVRLVRRELVNAIAHLRDTLANGSGDSVSIELARLASLCAEAREAMTSEMSVANE